MNEHKFFILETFKSYTVYLKSPCYSINLHDNVATLIN